MKKILVSWVCICAGIITGCRNDRTDDTRTDTAATAPLSPFRQPDTPGVKTGSTDLTKKDSAAPEKKPVATTVKKDGVEKTDSAKNKAEDVVRVKKVSKKGRIILQLLKENMDKIVADEQGVYNRAEVMPVYPGGEAALRDFIENRIQYPDNALNNEIQGTVKVYFAVDEEGKIMVPTIISPKLGYGLEEEALRIVNRMPKWVPGQVNGQNVKTRFTLPITFRID